MYVSKYFTLYINRPARYEISDSPSLVAVGTATTIFSSQRRKESEIMVLFSDQVRCSLKTSIHRKIKYTKMSCDEEREPLAAQPQQDRYREQTLLSCSMGSRVGGVTEDDANGKEVFKSCLHGNDFICIVCLSGNPIDLNMGRFECNICLDDVREPVVTQCGHLFCWSCLYRWLNTNHQTCPLCKAGVTKENVIPLFIRGSSKDPRDRVLNGFCLSCFLMTKCIISEVFTLVPFDPLRSLCRH